MSKNLKSIRKITKISILAVIAFLLSYISFPLPFAPAFYKMDFTNIPTLIGAFAFGPMAAVLIEVLRTFIKLIFIPTDTFFIGEASALLVNLSFALSAALIYKKHKTAKQAVLALSVGVICFTVVGAISNYFFIIPAYVHVMGFPLDAIIGMGRAIHSNVDSLLMLVIYCTIPFNLFKATVVAIVVKLIYKYISLLLKRHAHSCN